MTRVVLFVVRTSIIAAALVILERALGLVLPAYEAVDEATGVVQHLALQFLSAFLLAAALASPIARSRLRGRPLLGAVFLAAFGLSTALTQVESAVFLDVTTSELLVGTLGLTVNAAALSVLAVVLYPGSDAAPAGVARGPNPPTTASWVRRWIGVALAYVVLYITAGLLIYPVIGSWYESQGMPQPDPVFLLVLQIVRGALFVAFVLPLLRSMRVTRRHAALAMAAMIPLVHGVANLIPPNPYMPDYVRHAHLIEIGWSNFVLGLLIGFLFWNPSRNAERSVQPSEAAA